MKNETPTWFELYSAIMTLAFMFMIMYFLNANFEKINSKLDNIHKKEINVNLNDTSKIVILKNK